MNELGVGTPSDSFGVGIAGSAAPESGGGAEPNPNLLLWSDAFDNAVWAKSSCLVVANQDGVSDEMVSSAAGAAVRQVTSTVAGTGAAVTAPVSFFITYVRGSVTGTFDGTEYTFSVELRDTGAAADPAVTLRLDRSGGFLRCSIEDPAGDGDYFLRRAQLEVGPAFTTYSPREGT